MTDEQPTPIPVTDNLLIPWPTVRPFGQPVTAESMDMVWNEFVVKPQADEHIQSIEERYLMAILRAVYAGMHGQVRS